MSAAPVTAPRATRPATLPLRDNGTSGLPAAAPRPRLEVVRAPANPRTRVPFVLLCMAVLAASLLGALVLNTAMAQGEYERQQLQTRLAESLQESERLAGELEHAASPAELSRAARALGMVPTTHGGYLRLSDGAVLGDPVPAGSDG
jgi:hypothetical protein